MSPADFRTRRSRHDDFSLAKNNRERIIYFLLAGAFAATSSPDGRKLLFLRNEASAGAVQSRRRNTALPISSLF